MSLYKVGKQTKKYMFQEKWEKQYILITFGIFRYLGYFYAFSARNCVLCRVVFALSCCYSQVTSKFIQPWILSQKTWILFSLALSLISCVCDLQHSHQTTISLSLKQEVSTEYALRPFLFLNLLCFLLSSANNLILLALKF